MAFTLPIGSQAIDFCLSGSDGAVYTLHSFDQALFLVVFFTCNHCPYVIGSDEETRKTALAFQSKGVQFVAINSNAPEHYPEDSFDNMVLRMKEKHFPWIYLFDPSQVVASQYGALRTPHFYLFDKNRKLIYCGRGVDSPKDSSKITINNLQIALEEATAHKPISTPLTNPIGCNVKWHGHDKHWMPEEACDLIIK